MDSVRSVWLIGRCEKEREGIWACGIWGVLDKDVLNRACTPFKMLCPEKFVTSVFEARWAGRWHKRVLGRRRAASAIECEVEKQFGEPGER